MNYFARVEQRMAQNAEALAYIVEKKVGFTEKMTRLQLRTEVNRRAAHLRASGVGAGRRVLVLVKPGTELFASLLAVLKVGASAVLVDPGVSREALKRCLDRVRPEVMIASPLAQVFASTRREAFVSVTQRFSTRDWPAAPLDDVVTEPRLNADEAAVLFTSGATGTPKGCHYTHGHFNALVEQFETQLGFNERDVDLTTFAAFGLFAPALGVTSVLPSIDFRRPAKASPRTLRRALVRNRCTTMFASPALLERLVAEGPVEAPALRLSLCAGAPVSDRLATLMQERLPGIPLIPYGATECLLVSLGSAGERPEETALGVCVGRPIPGVTVRVVALGEQRMCAPFELGELCVAGPTVVTTYVGDSALTALAQWQCDGVTFHRMGDVGAIDADGRVWLAGRREHAVGTPRGIVFPVGVERWVERVKTVSRAALVSVDAVPTIVVDRRADVGLVKAALEEGPYGGVVDSVVRLRGPFPVDRRHNAKVDRIALGTQLATR